MGRVARFNANLVSEVNGHRTRPQFLRLNPLSKVGPYKFCRVA